MCGHPSTPRGGGGGAGPRERGTSGVREPPAGDDPATMRGGRRTPTRRGTRGSPATSRVRGSGGAERPPRARPRERSASQRRIAGNGERRRLIFRRIPRIVTALHTIHQCHGNCDVRDCSGSRFETVCSTLGPAEGAKDTPFAAPRTRPPTPPFFIHHSRCLSVRP